VRPPVLPSTGTGSGSESSAPWLFGSLAALVVLAGSAGLIAYRRR
jgi:hypothetical protein